MRQLQTTLLTGPYDWEPALLPRQEFEQRLARVREALAAAGAGALIVHGHAGDYGALNYLTGFVPKLAPAVALVPLTGPIRLFASGADLMLPWAKRLTWVEDVRTLANIAKLLSEWLRETGLALPVTLASWGEASMMRVLHLGVDAALANVGRLLALDATLDALRFRKSAHERALMREGCRILAAAAGALAAAGRHGAGNRSAALAAERAAYAAGAQDVRVQASARPGGAPMPLDSAREAALDPLLAAIVVQYAGYWSEGLITVAAVPGAALALAEAALAAMIAQVRAGTTAAALYRAACDRLTPCAPHPMMLGTVGYGIGLSPEEAPLRADFPDRLEAGGVYALRVGAQGVGADAALVSAMVAIDGEGSEILWQSETSR